MSDYNEEIHPSAEVSIPDVDALVAEASIEATPELEVIIPETEPETVVVEADAPSEAALEALPEVAITPEPAVVAPVLPSNDTVLSSSLDFYRNLLQQLDTNKQLIHTTRQELAQIRQQLRELSALSKRDARLEDETDSHGLHTSKVAAQYDDCGSIIAIAEQVRRHVYDNINEAEELLSPMMQSVDLLKLRVRYIRLLETLLAAQEAGLRLDIQQRNADACIWQLADILKV